MTIYTIGFTKKPASRFFGLLRDAGVKRVVDVRLNNASQLAGFAKKDDLAWLLGEICAIDYVHLPTLAPTNELLTGYRKGAVSWAEYEHWFHSLMRERRIEATVPRDVVDQGCLLCSEHEPDRCHRRLVAEYLDERWGGVEIVHLGH